MTRLNNFMETRFPVDISYGSIGGPVYFTNIVSMYAGHEQRNINWANARRKYNVSYGIKNDKQFQELVAFFHNCRGRAIGFRFKDWSDYVCDKQLVGVGDGISQTFQLYKSYETQLLDGNTASYKRKIDKPVFGTVKVYFDDMNLDNHSFFSTEEKFTTTNDFPSKDRDNSTSGVIEEAIKKNEENFIFNNPELIIDYTSGAIFFTKPPNIGVKIMASFEFDIPARFDNDYLPTRLEGLGLNSINDIQIVEIKLIHNLDKK